MALGMVVALCVAVALIAGPPDPRKVLELFQGTSPTAPTESALVTLLCWLAVVSLTLAVASAFRTARRRGATRSRVGAVAILVAGVALLGAGIAHRGGYSVCCATPATAHQAEQLVH
jgi:hypothetical protein